MDPHRRESSARTRRITSLYDRLVELVRRLAPERRQALLDELEHASHEGNEESLGRTTSTRRP